MSAVPSVCAWLISLPGNPSPLRFQLKPGPTGELLLGRAKDCDVRLPAESEEVSRHHARVLHQLGRWSLVDLGSRWGTRVNGVEIPRNCAVPITDGDGIYVHPWAFRFIVGSDLPSRTICENDIDVTSVHTLGSEPGEALREEWLSLLLEGAAILQGAANERALAARLVDIARRGCGMDVAVLRAMDADGLVEILAPESAPLPSPLKPLRFSRALLTAASKGVVAEYSPDSGSAGSETMVRSNVVLAICAPLLVGPTVYAYLYVQCTKEPRHGTSGFCQALARVGGLALANLQRIEIARLEAQRRAELRFAAVTQSVILPRSPITTGSFVCHGRSQPGDGYLGGDFFDIQVLPRGKLAVSLGDVSGRGVQASILMAFAQGFLRAAIAEHGNLVRAASALNRFVAGHSHSSQYVTLWLGLLDPTDMTLSYVDAGHGLAYRVKGDDQWQLLNELADLAIGIEPDSQYMSATVPLERGERLLIISDGIVEQRCPDLEYEDNRLRFGFERVRAALRNADCNCVVDRLFDAVEHFAGSKELVDDTTALLVHW